MRPWLTSHNIEVVAMTFATATAIQQQIERDGLGFPIMIDHNLELTKRLGWYDRSGLKHVTWRVFGIPLGVPGGFRAMPRPATALVNETGVIRWLDLTDDYRLRGDEDRIRTAVHATFGSYQ